LYQVVINYLAFNPGPGAYESNFGFNEIANMKKYVAELEKVGIDKKVYIRPDSIFVSKDKRFNFQNTNKEFVPGPGWYDIIKSSSKCIVNYHYPILTVLIVRPGIKMMRKSASQEEMSNMPKLTCPPSIPSHEYSKGYDDTDHARVLKIHPGLKFHYTGEVDNSVGPGQYETSEFRSLNPKGTTWHASKTKRDVSSLESIQKNSEVGPGKYELPSLTQRFQKINPDWKSLNKRPINKPCSDKNQDIFDYRQNL